MKKLSLILLFACFGVIINAQTASDTIRIIKRLGPVFQQHGVTLMPKQLMTITETNPEAFKEMKIANSNYVASLFFQIPGGFLIGYPLGTAVGGGEPNWTMAAIGAGLVIVAIPLISGYNKHATNAVKIYNSGLTSYSKPATTVKLGFSGSGLGVKVQF
jgi:hypothetical protein